MAVEQTGFAEVVLHKLLDKYEESTAFLRGEPTTRRIQVNMTDSLVPKYKSGGMDPDERQALHQKLNECAAQGIVELDWVKFERGNLLSRVLLQWDGIEAAYRMVGRTPKWDELTEITSELNRHRYGLTLSWMQQFVSDVLTYITERRTIPAQLIPPESDKREMLLQALAGLAHKGDEVLPMRLFSKRYLGSSKAFEKHIRSRFVSLLRQYALEQTGESLDDSAVLSEVGIEMTHDDVAFCGPLILQFKRPESGTAKSAPSSPIHCSRFPLGMSLDSESLSNIEIVHLPVRRILTIENKANYRHYIRHERRADELVIYLAGFPSPAKRRFLATIRDFVSGATFHHWGDLDYGGIIICQTLRDRVLPNIQPWRMDPNWLDKLRQFVEPFDDSYRARLESLLVNPRYDAWRPLVKKCLEVGGTLEQEAFIV